MGTDDWAALHLEHLRAIAALCPTLEPPVDEREGDPPPPLGTAPTPTEVVDALRAWNGALARVPASELNPEQDRERRILSDLVDLCVFSAEHAPAGASLPYMLSPPFAKLAALLLRGDAATSEAERAVELLEALPEHLARHRAHVQRAPACVLELARRALARAPESLEALASRAREIAGQGALATRIESAVADAGAAVEQHQRWLEELGVDGAGAGWGQEQLDELSARLRLPYSVDELRGFVSDRIEELQIERVRAAQRVQRDVSSDEVMAQLQAEQPASFEAGLAALRSSIDAASSFLVEQRICDLDGVKPPALHTMPASLAVCSPELASVTAPRRDAGEHGVILVAAPDAGVPLSGFSPAQVVNRALRWVFPGRHLLHRAAESGVPGVRRAFAVSRQLPGAATWAEDLQGGWGGYSMEMARELGFANAPGEVLQLADACLRDAQLAAIDLDLNRGGLTPDAAAARMVEELGVPEGRARAEICAMVYAPLRRAAAVIGTWRLFELRRHVKGLWHEAFSLQGFHAFVLGAGVVPLCYLVEAIASVEPPEVERS